MKNKLKKYAHSKILQYGSLAIGSALALVGLLSVSAKISQADMTTDSSGAISSTTEPMISNILASTTADGTGATLSWTTDENATASMVNLLFQLRQPVFRCQNPTLAVH